MLMRLLRHDHLHSLPLRSLQSSMPSLRTRRLYSDNSNSNNQPSLPKNTIPAGDCIGCGVRFQSLSPGKPGYLPANFRQRSKPPSVHSLIASSIATVEAAHIPQDAITPRQLKHLLRTQHNPTEPDEFPSSHEYSYGSSSVVCQYCHNLHNHSPHLQLARPPVDFEKVFARVKTLGSSNSTTLGKGAGESNLISRDLSDVISGGPVIVHVVDCLDYSGTLIKELQRYVGEGRRGIVVLTKTDALKNSPFSIEKIMRWVKTALKASIGSSASHTPTSKVSSDDEDNSEQWTIIPVSSVTGTGLSTLVDRIRTLRQPAPSTVHTKHLKLPDVYLVGRPNVGKSMLVRALLQMAGGINDIRRTPTVSMYPGTTIGFISMPLNRFGTLFEGISGRQGDEGKKTDDSVGEEEEEEEEGSGGDVTGMLYDTPGIFGAGQLLTQFLTESELKMAGQSNKIHSKFFDMYAGRSMLIGSMARIDVEHGEIFRMVTCFQYDLTRNIHVCKTSRADEHCAAARDIHRDPRKTYINLAPPSTVERTASLPPLTPVTELILKKNPKTGIFDSVDVVLAGLGWVTLYVSNAQMAKMRLGNVVVRVSSVGGVGISTRPSAFDRGLDSKHVSHQSTKLLLH